METVHLDRYQIQNGGTWATSPRAPSLIPRAVKALTKKARHQMAFEGRDLLIKAPCLKHSPWGRWLPSKWLEGNNEHRKKEKERETESFKENKGKSGGDKRVSHRTRRKRRK
ncbi:hypothetical protein V6N13_092759 [Hibiscus sabdariffa]